MRTVGSRLRSCAGFLALVFALGVVGAIVGVILADAVSGGAFVYWHSLGLADQQGVDLLQTDAGLAVRTADGKQLYHRRARVGGDCGHRRVDEESLRVSTAMVTTD